MADDRIEVKIVANTADLASGVEAGKAALGQLKVSAADLGTALRNAGNDLSKITPTMLGIGGAAGQAASGVREAGSVIKGAATEAVAATNGLRAATSGAIQEYVRLGHEAMTGNFARMPGSLVVLASRMGGLQSVVSMLTPEMVAGGAAAVAFAGALALLAKDAYDAENSFEKAQMAFSANAITASDDQIKKLNESLRALMPDKAAESLTYAMAQMKGATVEGMTAIVDYIDTESEKTGLDAEHAGMQLIKGYEEALKSPQPVEALHRFFDQMRDTAQRDTAQRDTATFQRQMQGNAFIPGTVQVAVDQSQTEQAKAAADAASAALKALAATPSAMPATTFADLDKAASGLKTVGTSAVETARQTLSFWTQAQQQAEQYGGPVVQIDQKIAQATQALAQAQQEAAKQGGKGAPSGGALDAFRVKVDEARASLADMGATEQQQLARVAAMWQEEAQAAGLSAKEKLAAEQQYVEARLALDREVSDDAKRANAEDESDWEQHVEFVRRQLSEMSAAAKRAAEESAAAWQDGLRPIDQAASSIFGAMIERNERFGTAASSAARKMATEWVEAVAQIMVKLAELAALKGASALFGGGSTALGGALGGGANTVEASLLKSLGPLGGLLGGGGTANALASGAVPYANSTTDAGAQSVAQLEAAFTANTAALNALTAALHGQPASAASPGASGSGSTSPGSGAALGQIGSLASMIPGGSAISSILSPLQMMNSLFSSGGLFGAGGMLSKLFSGGLGSLFSSGGMFAGIGSLFSALPFFAEGTDYVPSTGPAMIHQGEMVIPASIAPMLRGVMSGGTAFSGGAPSVPNFFSGLDSSGGGPGPLGLVGGNGASGSTSIGGGGGASFTFSPQISAMDARSVYQVFNNPVTGRNLAAQVQRFTNLNPSLG